MSPPAKVYNIDYLQRRQGACSTRAKCRQCQHLTWPALEYSLPKLEHNITSKRNSKINTDTKRVTQ